jgi:16S rRNA (adenine1518-N6/adenine1519-N6)-dimethyltransferase
MKVPPAVFHPAPNVESAVVQLRRKDVNMKDLKPYFEFVKRGFVQRRKTLVNNMKDTYDIKEALIKMNLSESVRGEALTSINGKNSMKCRAYAKVNLRFRCGESA